MKILLKEPQWTVFGCDQRFRVLVAGRRFGKTYLALVELCQAASVRGCLAWYVAPTYKQAKRIAWKTLKQMTKGYWASKPNETDLRIELVWGGTICLRGADNYDSLRGDGLDFLVLDEYASIAREAWTEVLRPALADKQGKALFIGTPHGRNHFFELYEAALDQPQWARFQFTTAQGGNVTVKELESATHELDERTYRQEFQASFESLGVGMVYYAFDRRQNIRDLRYNPAVA
jgi:terminase large subunit-like protein